ncbi:hypothetical protein STEG23_001346 [Scotinomys teguina]
MRELLKPYLLFLMDGDVTQHFRELLGGAEERYSDKPLGMMSLAFHPKDIVIQDEIPKPVPVMAHYCV